jgi:hypothetical protein
VFYLLLCFSFKKFIHINMKKEINPEDIWNEDKIEKICNHIKTESKKQSIFRKIRNKYLSIKYKIENCIKF